MGTGSQGTEGPRWVYGGLDTKCNRRRAHPYSNREEGDIQFLLTKIDDRAGSRGSRFLHCSCGSRYFGSRESKGELREPSRVGSFLPSSPFTWFRTYAFTCLSSGTSSRQLVLSLFPGPRTGAGQFRCLTIPWPVVTSKGAQPS